MNNLIKQLLKENLILEAAKQGSGEELIELLEFLPVDDTAKYLTEEIYQDIVKYYINDISPKTKDYTYYPQDKCLKPYIVQIDFRPSNNMAGIGYAQEDYIQVKYLSKDAPDYDRGFKLGGAERLQKSLFNIIKHECSHFYLAQKGVENCIYNTHPDGMKKYYQDRQELVLHTREIYDTFSSDYPNWKTMPIESIIKRLTYVVKNLPRHTNINSPFGSATQKKYLNFIVKNYIKPNLQEKPIINEDDESEKIFKLLASYVNTPDNQNSVGVDEIFYDYHEDENGFAIASKPINDFFFIIDVSDNNYSLDIHNVNNGKSNLVNYKSFDELYKKLASFLLQSKG